MAFLSFENENEIILKEGKTDLIGNTYTEENKVWGDEKIYHIPTDKIVPNPMQPRCVFDEEAIKSLSDSIAKYGILQPLTVRNISSYDDGESYELVAGERRLRAAKELGLDTVPCLIISVNDKQSAELAIIENLQREDLNIFEEASAISALLCIYSLTQEQVASRLAVSQSYVANKLRLLRLSDTERQLITDNSLTERHARALVKITDAEQREKVLRKIIERKLNVSQSEEYIDSILEPKEKTTEKQHLFGAIKDVRLFYNSIDNALKIFRRSGMNVTTKKKEMEDEIELTIRIRKPTVKPADLFSAIGEAK